MERELSAYDDAGAMYQAQGSNAFTRSFRQTLTRDDKIKTNISVRTVSLKNSTDCEVNKMNIIRIYTRSQIQPILEKYIYQAYENDLKAIKVTVLYPVNDQESKRIIEL